MTEKKKAAAKPKKEKTPEPVPEVIIEELIVEEISPDEEEELKVKSWNHEGTDYYKACDGDCEDEEDNCECTGVVYDTVTQDPVGTWNGTEIVPLAEEED